MPHPNVNEIAKWLMNAPQVARDRAPFFWTYLDKPADGTIFLTWQPLQRLGTSFATDGFVWAPQEHLYKHDLGNGLVCLSSGSLWRCAADSGYCRCWKYTIKRPAISTANNMPFMRDDVSDWCPSLGILTRRSPTSAFSSFIMVPQSPMIAYPLTRSPTTSEPTPRCNSDISS